MYIGRLIFFSVVFIAFKSYGQTKITGLVSDGNNNPVELAMVKLKELNRIAMTNDSGIFRMTLPANLKKDEAITVLVTKEGYKDAVKQVSISDRSIVIKLISLTVADTVKTTVKHHPAITIDYLQNPIAVKQSKGAITRKLDKDNARDMLMYLPDKNEPISITCIGGDQEASGFAEQIKDFLTLNGYKKVGDVTQATFTTSITGQFLNRDKTGVTITIGHMPVEKNR
jgi:uncharacterized protein YjgD (DUF1641 family)